MSVPCPFCGGPVVGKKKGAKFCSDNCRKRVWERGPGRDQCAECGGRMGINTKGRGWLRCDPCRRQLDTEQVAERGRQIERWWAEGLGLQEMADRLGWGRGHVGVEIFRLREKGFDLPYRNHWEHHEAAA